MMTSLSDIHAALDIVNREHLGRYVCILSPMDWGARIDCVDVTEQPPLYLAAAVRFQGIPDQQVVDDARYKALVAIRSFQHDRRERATLPTAPAEAP